MSEFKFPDGFMWGSATSGHQVEGNNSNTESWVIEQLPETDYAEPSGIACDHYNRYPEDIALMAKLGFNAYRFSIEWARIEPEEGEFSTEALDHYRRVLATCHENGIQPAVTFHHFVSPRWLFHDGGWLSEKTPERFARYCEKVTNHLGDLISLACTVNEPNISIVLSHLLPFKFPDRPWWPKAAEAFGVSPDNLGLFQFVTQPKMWDIIFEAHRRAYEVLHAGPGDFPVGLTLALHEFQSTKDGEEMTAQYRHEMADAYLERLGNDDFVGVQNYGRMVIGPYGRIAPTPLVEVNQMGEEFYPEALGGAIRYAAQATGLPIYVTENGMPTEDDSRRNAYLRGAIGSVAQCLQDGIDVRGYFAWSTFDNFEWVAGYKPKFGIIAVDRETQTRTPKPSAHWLGNVARKNTYQFTELDNIRIKRPHSMIPTQKEPYLLRDREGPRYLLGTQLATVIASAESTGSIFELVALSGGKGESFPPHRHNHTHEGIYVLHGLVEIILGDEHYLMSQGDYAHIPAGTVHAYRMVSHNNRILSVTMNGQIGKIYSHIGTPTDLHVHPPHGESLDIANALSKPIDDTDIELVDVAPPNQAPQPITNIDVPETVVPYVIASGGGIHKVVGRDVFVLLATQANTGGEFIILDNEGTFNNAIIQHYHEKHTETFFCTAGQMRMWGNGEEHLLNPGDFLHVPAGIVHSFRFEAHYTRFFSVLAPGIFEPFFHALGSPYDGHIFPDEPGPARFDRLMAATQAGELDLKVVGPPPDSSGHE